MKTITLRKGMLAFIALWCMTLSLQAQSFTVTGRVTSASDGDAMIGATVTIKGTTQGTTTDIDGTYSIQVQEGNVLVFFNIGYIPQEIMVSSKRSVVNVQLKEEVSQLEEVVIAIPYRHPSPTRDVRNMELRNNSSGKQADLSYVSDESVVVAYGVVRPPVVHTPNSEEYNSVRENGFQSVGQAPLSTFSVDVDVASYGNMRRHVNNGQLPPADAIRTEELINYFSYSYPQPIGKDPVHISTEVGTCPWNHQHRLVRIGVKAREIADENLPASNLVFLIDVSGSMWGPTRLDLVKASLKLLVNNLREQDKVSIVVYAGAAGEVLPATSGADKQKIREALDQLTAGGSTAGGAGIQLAYKIAEKNFIKGGNNRIILCTDGDFNVGVSSTDGLEKMIEEKRKTGVFLTVLGYGMGNYKDNRMQVLAEKGNGNYAYIDNLQEANKVLVTEFGGTMYAVAKDVKLQIEFNPAHVQAYRLVGYESRLLQAEDFNDDTKDAGEMGAGHCVTAFYEVIPVGVKSNWIGSVDDLKYQATEKKRPKAVVNPSPEMLTVKLRYKEPDGEVSKKIEKPLTDRGGDQVSADFRFAAAVAMFGQLLRSSDYKGEVTYDDVVKLAEKGLDKDSHGYRREFIRLVKTVDGISR